MPTLFRKLKLIPILSTAILMQSAPGWSASLTGLHAFEADASGNRVLPMAAYTYVPNGGSYVLWIAPGDMNAPFVNGPLRDDATIAIALNPGVYTFYTFSAAGTSEGQSIFPGPIPARVGMNFFFDENQDTPGISVYAPTNLSAVGPYPLFSPNGGATSNLAGDQSPVGSGSLTYIDGGLSISLTDFLYSSPLVFNEDRIANFQTIPEGDREYVGQFTLTVQSVVPEPGTMMLVGITIMLGLNRAIPRRRVLRTGLLMATCCLLPAQTQPPTDPGGWTAAKWGMTEEQVMAAFPGEAVRLTEPLKSRSYNAGVATIGIKHYRIRMQDFEVLFLMGHQSNVLEQVILRATDLSSLDLFGVASMFKGFEPLLLEKYGPPTYRDVTDASRPVSTWYFPTTIISLSGTQAPKKMNFPPDFGISYARNRDREKL